MLAHIPLAAILIASPAPPRSTGPLSAQEAKAAPPRVLKSRVFNLPALLGKPANPGHQKVGFLFQPWLSSEGKKVEALFGWKEWFLEDTYEPFLPFQQLKADILAWTGTSAWEKGTAAIGLFGKPGSRFFLVQDLETLNSAAGFLKCLQQTLRPRLVFKAALFLQPGPPSEPPYQVLDPVQGENLFQKVARGDIGRLLFASSGEGLAYDTLFLGKIQVLHLLRNLDVEVAHKSKIVDPVLSTLQLKKGIRLTAVPSLTGDRMELFGLFFYQDPLAGPRGMGLQTGQPRMFIEKARIENIQTGFASLFTDRTALLLAPGSLRRPRLRLLLLVKRIDPYPTTPARYAVLPGGRGNQGREMFSNESFPPLDNREEWAAPNLENKRLAEILTSLQPGSLNILPSNSHLLVIGPQNLVAKARAFTKVISEPYMRRFRLEVFREGMPVDPLGDEERNWTPLGLPSVVPCLGGRGAFVIQGREETFVKDYNAEIAQAAAASNPEVESCFDGTQILVRVEPAGSLCSVKLDLLETSILGMRRVSSAENSYVGTIEAPDLRKVHWKLTFYMKPGEMKVLGSGPPRLIGERLYRTRVSIRLLED